MSAVYSDCRCPACRSEQQAILAEALRESLGAFARWMNRPIQRVHVYTWRLAVETEPRSNPQGAIAIRYLPPYRGVGIALWRRNVANLLRQQRKAGRIVLPKYDERSATYV